ncbi:curlin [Rhodopseudomonas sp.]|uniref:curlin n=1 Tax=Rhodopseudomonas sp. TaxID=1078 RepID=UPI0039E58892
MKRNLFFVTASVLALSATAAMADSNTVVLNQADTSHHATIEQFNSGNNVGSYSGWSGFDQNNNGGLVGGNQLTVTQAGYNNSVGRDAKGYQYGAGNSAVISQAGNGSDVELQQKGENNGSVPAGWDWTNDPGIFNKITQDSTSTGSKVSVVQDGSNNVFSIKQGNTSNSTSVTQTGAWGLAYVRQGIGVAEQDKATANWLPTGGNSNVATISQASSGVNYAVAVQGGGNSNSLSIGQTGALHGANAWQIGSTNTFSSIQTGTGNTAGLSGGIYGADDPIKQIGNSNSYVSTQSGSYNTANGSQTGDLNYVTNVQTGSHGAIAGTQNGYYNSVDSVQSGSYNTLKYAQTNVSGSSWNQIVNSQTGAGTVLAANLADIKQDGYGLYSNGVQSGGDGNSATVSQVGTYHISYYTQTGSSNVLGVTQTGSGNHSNVHQVGTGNSASVIQH